MIKNVKFLFSNMVYNKICLYGFNILSK